jgi:hypothetical protein
MDVGGYYMKNIKTINTKRLFFLIATFVLFSLVLSSINVYAHSPSDMNLTFNNTTKELEVKINHQVSDPNSHYVYSIVVKINGVTNLSEDYTSQPGNSFTYTYENIETNEDDIIEVTALCNQGGSISRQLTVTSSDVSESDENGSTPGFELLLFIITIIALLIIIRKK